MEDKEVWQNVSGSQIYIRILDPRGNEKFTHIRPNQKITISPLERRINQDRTATEKGDFFKNGMLTAVRLINTEEDYADLATNPNLISESEIADMFSLTPAKFKNRINEITNFTVIRRLIDYAEREDTKASMPQMRALEARKEELDEAPKNVYVDPKDPVPPVGIN